MSDLRTQARFKKRLSVKFGHDQLENIGFTCDVSSRGLYLQSKIVYKPGIILIIEITMRDGTIILFEGKVRWSKKAPTEFSHKMKSGMGIQIQKFLQGEDVFKTIFLQ